MGFQHLFFSKDKNDVQYFVHFDSLANGNWEDWKQITIGSKIYVAIGDTPTATDRAIPVEEAYISSIYSP